LDYEICTRNRTIVTYTSGEAGEVFGEAATAAGNAAMTYMNIQSLGVKGLVKKTAKTTGKELGKAVLDAHSSKQPVA
jgi:hypothetical protein